MDHPEEEGENDIDDELDHEEAEDLLADESLEQKTDIITGDIVSLIASTRIKTSTCISVFI